MKQFFYSLKTGYILFILLAVIFGTGNYLTGISEYNSIFKDMTATHLMYCLKAILVKPVMVIWFLTFIFIGICLFINTWCCTTTQIRLFFRTRKLERSKVDRVGQMALIHIAALMVIALHALDITMIQRHKPVKFYSDQIVRMGDYQVRVKQISYVDLNSMITDDKTGSKRKGLQNLKKDFSTKQNFARIEIIKDPEKPAVRDIRMLSPVRIGATFFFLDEFFIARDSQRIGVKIHHSYNPLVFVIFAVYMLLFGLFVFRFFTFRVKGNGKK